MALRRNQRDEIKGVGVGIKGVVETKRVGRNQKGRGVIFKKASKTPGPLVAA